MEWLLWHGLYIIFWMFGKRTYTEATAAGGEWHRQMGRWTLKIRVNDVYGQHAYTLYCDGEMTNGVVF